MIILSILFFITAILYSSVGFGGGSTYLALLLIWDIPYFIFPIIALLCNIIVVSGNSFNYIRAGNHNFKLILPFLIGSVPLAFFGGTLKIDKDIFEILPKDRTTPYDMLEIIKRLVDKSEFDQYKEGYGKTILTGYARIDGWAVGIVANQRKLVKTKNGEMQFGGVIYNDSADKATRFIANCNQKKIPLIFLQDVTGFMVGSKSEHSGIIKDGAKMVNAVSNSVVPKFTIIIGNSYGAGNYAMCGKAYDPRLIVSWPSAELAVMSGNSALTVLLQIETA